MSDDGRTLLAGGSGDRGVALVDLTTNGALGSPLYAADAGPADISPDGESVVLPVADAIALWTLEPEAQASALCDFAGREPTAEEWADSFAALGEQFALCP